MLAAPCWKTECAGAPQGQGTQRRQNTTQVPNGRLDGLECGVQDGASLRPQAAEDRQYPPIGISLPHSASPKATVPMTGFSSSALGSLSPAQHTAGTLQHAVMQAGKANIYSCLSFLGSLRDSTVATWAELKNAPRLTWRPTSHIHLALLRQIQFKSEYLIKGAPSPPLPLPDRQVLSSAVTARAPSKQTFTHCHRG
ncbi:hypothetical protein E2C01_079239 [Portunus trituberculatus]|uniref:Uncharacterized protein n=1 Tax=Portunus trituberculatus TaxID=210409 RepID=A0A5B7IJ30_PORTR|nr:hypothetical protein [Portunus trituberculatus]